MLDQIVCKCSERYHSTVCNECSYLEYCPHNCGRCLHFIHTPTDAPAPRKYDCTRMADYYVCKYANKYTSELYYAFEQLTSISTLNKLKVLSIGCGPCTDLLALSKIVASHIYQFEELDYRGIDINIEIWKNEIEDLRCIAPDTWSIRIANGDICEKIEAINNFTWRPNLIVLQYVFSDMQKNSEPPIIIGFIKALATYIESCPVNTYIVCNDINLSVQFQGGRDYFDILLDSLNEFYIYRKYHFNNSNRANHFDYGNEYAENALICRPHQSSAFSAPYQSCSSAQLIIKKVTEDDYQRQ